MAKYKVNWAAVIISIIGLGIAVTITLFFNKILEALGLKKTTDEKSEEKETTDDIKDAKKEGIEQTYTETNYNTFADTIYRAEHEHFKTDWESIYNIFKKMKNKLDILKLIEAFGKKRPKLEWNEVSLPTFLISAVGNEGITYINQLLKGKKINYAF